MLVKEVALSENPRVSKIDFVIDLVVISARDSDSEKESCFMATVVTIATASARESDSERVDDIALLVSSTSDSDSERVDDIALLVSSASDSASEQENP